ncbi:MAG: histidine kinase [Marinilabiliales bacterium]|nr:MAG: histidine kinase [Marinilabiliales bacterium]
MKGEFLTTKRSSKKVVSIMNKQLSDSSHILELVDASNTMFMILNHNRQIVVANKILINLLNTPTDNILGQRPGEVFNCINAKKLETGCGTHIFCRECGAANAIFKAINGEKAQNECRISSIINGKNISYDLLVQCQPMLFNKETYVLMSVVDNSDKKRREVLEKTFFHYILNTAGGVYGYTKILKKKVADSPNNNEYAEIACKLAERLIKEIKGQQLLLDAERHNLSLNLVEIEVSDLFNEVIDLIKENKEVKECNFNTSLTPKNLKILTDEILLQKVILNIVKNAAEACKEGQSVTIRGIRRKGFVYFTIHNPGFIPIKIQHQIFQRSFSTKGNNRGIGTYSIKLFTENYLNGEVWFESTPNKGTYFHLKIPERLES